MSIEISVNNATEDVKTYADAIFIAGQKLVEKKQLIQPILTPALIGKRIFLLDYY